MIVRPILRFLLILLVSIFLASLVVFCDFRLLNFTVRKTNGIKFGPVIVFSKRDCPLVWKLVEYTFNH